MGGILILGVLMTDFECVKIGDCTLYLGDNLAVMATLGRVDAVITDVPYVIKTSGGGKFRESRQYLDEIKDEGLADGFNIEVFYLAERMGIVSLVTFYSELQEDVIYRYFKGMYYSKSLPLFWDSSEHDAWIKTNPIPFANKSYQANVEYIRHGWREPFFPQGEYADKSKYFVSGVGRCVYGHPTEKPVELMRKLVINASKPDFVVLDPYMGSGTTGEACMREGRAFIGIEHNKAYFDMAVKRIGAVYSEMGQI